MSSITHETKLHSIHSLHGTAEISSYLKKHATAFAICAAAVANIAIAILVGYAAGISCLAGMAIGFGLREISMNQPDLQIHKKIRQPIDEASQEMQEMLEKSKKSAETERKAAEAASKVADANLREFNELTKNW